MSRRHRHRASRRPHAHGHLVVLRPLVLALGLGVKAATVWSVRAPRLLRLCRRGGVGHGAARSAALRALARSARTRLRRQALYRAARSHCCRTTADPPRTYASRHQRCVQPSHGALPSRRRSCARVGPHARRARDAAAAWPTRTRAPSTCGCWRCLRRAMQHDAASAEALASVAPDVAEAAAAAAFELPVHAFQPPPSAPAAAPAERGERAAGDAAEDDGFEFGSDAESDSSSSWASSEEETGSPITGASLPAWLARRTAGGRCARRGGCAPCRHSRVLFTQRRGRRGRRAACSRAACF